eukprot:gene6061-biopygen16344
MGRGGEAGTSGRACRGQGSRRRSTRSSTGPGPWRRARRRARRCGTSPQRGLGRTRSPCPSSRSDPRSQEEEEEEEKEEEEEEEEGELRAAGGSATRRCRLLESAARGCRRLEVPQLEDSGSWRFSHSGKQAAGVRRSRMLATGGSVARGCWQLGVPPLGDAGCWSPLEDAGRWRFRRTVLRGCRAMAPVAGGVGGGGAASAAVVRGSGSVEEAAAPPCPTDSRWPDAAQVGRSCCWAADDTHPARCAQLTIWPGHA